MPSDFWKPDSDTIWISSPSRIHETPSPKTTDQWNLVHGSRSMRAGTRLLMAPPLRCATASLITSPLIRTANGIEPAGSGQVMTRPHRELRTPRAAAPNTLPGQVSGPRHGFGRSVPALVLRVAGGGVRDGVRLLFEGVRLVRARQRLLASVGAEG